MAVDKVFGEVMIGLTEEPLDKPFRDPVDKLFVVVEVKLCCDEFKMPILVPTPLLIVFCVTGCPLPPGVKIEFAVWRELVVGVADCGEVVFCGVALFC